ncbi:DedA family protein [Cellulomonas composti]|uniref:Uncharacterized protein n=1 Tax=Cellulomonas composti TaxID=266130 RepID=A0A511J9R2_9CELL|nr:hypothetical protein [Cellulomonas composti]GEL94724.1 hypothetical protein CCO02nite_13820 [Cellulomonas composti]
MDDDPIGFLGLSTLSAGIAVGVLFVIGMARSHATYWAGRGVVRGAKTVHESDWGFTWWRAMITRLEAWTNTHAAQRGLDWVRRWGALAVMFAFLTIGLQTAVFASAGLIKMRYLRFTLATIPGAIVWSVVWATVGLGAVWGAIALFATSPWALLGAVVVLVVLGVWIARRRLERAAHRHLESTHLHEHTEHGRHAAVSDEPATPTPSPTDC